MLRFTAFFISVAITTHAHPEIPAFTLAGELRNSVPAPSPAAVEARYIDVNAAAIRLDANALRIPLFDREIVASRTQAQAQDGRISWQGIIEGNASEQITLTYDGKHLAGYISVASGIFEITPTQGGNVLMRIDTDRFPDCSAIAAPNETVDLSPAHLDSAASDESSREMLLNEPGNEPRAPIASAQNQGSVEIAVLIVVAPGSVTQLGGQAAAMTFAQQAVDSANLVFSNSQMTARFRLAGVRFTTRAENGDSNIDLTWLQSDPGVANWRNDVGADMVGMLAELTGVCGLGYVLGAPPGGDAFAFQVTTRSCAVGNLSYAHEHGHNMSMLHNFGDTNSAFNYGVGHLVDGVFRTVMNTQSGPRRPYFSNPNVSFMGNPTGIANARDNARVGAITAPSIAQFRGVANLIFSSSFE